MTEHQLITAEGSPTNVIMGFLVTFVAVWLIYHIRRIIKGHNPPHIPWPGPNRWRIEQPRPPYEGTGRTKEIER